MAAHTVKAFVEVPLNPLCIAKQSVNRTHAAGLSGAPAWISSSALLRRGTLVGVTYDGVVNVHYPRVCASEQLNPRLDEFIKKVHVLQTPPLYGGIEASGSNQVPLVDADDPEAVVPPQARLGGEDVVVVAGDLPSVHHLGVVLAEDDGEVGLLPQGRVGPTTLEELAGEKQIHVAIEEQ
ncbi:hypothetical protein EYF80_014370 [Liparis tanakae]|uniref:Uncharacterized protein n=1 Tax=Liparis tanakae TaxID=230148 RepID=A0A4Z2IE87_9TELE|nr:hypothetical protein EYF80_014370 [Liparis tanakae]